jgi:ribosomal protein L44E
MKMPSEIRTICYCCKEQIGEIQEIKGKAFCEDCEEYIFESVGVNSEKIVTVEEHKRKMEREEEEHFIKAMQRVFRYGGIR